MRIITFLAAAAVALHCDITGVGFAMKNFLFGHQHEQKTESPGQRMLKADGFRMRVEQSFVDVTRGIPKKRQVLKDGRYPLSTWQDGVFYMFNTSDLVINKVFKMGAKVWSEATCIDFIEDKNAKDRVVVIRDEACWSNIGRIGGDQCLSLDDNATVGAALHEIGHVLGLFHTMQRYDRDDYIEIVEKNVDPFEIDQFEIASINYSDVYGLAYDYGSVMHYRERSFSVNNQLTMIAKDPYYQKTMGSELISFSDIFVINEHYGCNAKCDKSTSVKCVNEGFPHPRNCSTCICPSGYGGALCDRRPPGCGEDLLATGNKQTLAYKLGTGVGLRDKFDFCNYMITAPEGKKIEVEICPISDVHDESGCPRGGVEVKAQKDQKITGYRFCSMRCRSPIVSSSNRLPVIVFNRLGMMSGNLTYRYID